MGIIIVICLLVTLITLIYESETDSILFNGVVGTFLFALLFLLSNFCLFLVANPTEDLESKEVNTVLQSEELVCFEDAYNTYADSFYILGTGGTSQDSDMTYKYYVKTDKGSTYKELKTSEEKIYIQTCSDDQTPHVELVEETKVTREQLTKKINFWTTDLIHYIEYKDKEVGDIIETDESLTSKKYYIFYIPEGSFMINDYNLDMK